MKTLVKFEMLGFLKKTAEGDAVIYPVPVQGQKSCFRGLFQTEFNLHSGLLVPPDSCSCYVCVMFSTKGFQWELHQSPALLGVKDAFLCSAEHQ